MLNYKEQLKRQLDFIERSCFQYDHEHKDEAIRIAVALRVLFHQTKKSTSLISHLKANRIRLLSTAGEPAGKASKFHFALTDIRINIAPPGVEFRPLLNRAALLRYTNLDDWWDVEKAYVYDLTPRSGFATRKRIVLAAANQDGGAHVDSSRDADYEFIESGCSFHMDIKSQATGETTQFPARNGCLAALRQMGYEVLRSPELIDLLR